MKTSKIISLLTEDNLDDAFNSFEHFFENIQQFKKQLVILKGQYNDTVTGRNSGTMDADLISLFMNKTRKGLFELLAELESSIEPDAGENKKTNPNALSKSQELQKKAGEAVKDKDYKIIGEIYSELACIFYKAEKISVHINDFYVVQLLNQYQLVDAQTPFDKKLLDFFSDYHPPFVKIEEFESGNPCYIIRDYVDGIDLNNLINHKIRLSLLDSIKSSITMAKGLAELHKNKITYSNFIPSQVIMDINGATKILPMNIFKTNRDVVTWRQLKNSVKYMSPEQLVQTGGKNFRLPLDPLCNQYSLGQIIFFMLNGESIFEGSGLAELYEDRIDSADTISQLRQFVDSIHQQLLCYSIPEEMKDEMGSLFIQTFNQLLKFKPEKRYNDIDDFIMEMEGLKYQLEKAIKKFGDDDLPLVQESFEYAVFNNKNTIDDFYKKLLDEITLRSSIEIPERNILFYYSMKYLFNSISNLNHEEGLNQALTCLVQSLHIDIDINDFEIFFEVLKNVIKENNSEDWNERVDEAWTTFNQKVLDAIDSILTPSIPGT